MTEKLTRSESAKLFADIVGRVVTRAPDSTGGIRMFGVADFLATVDVAGMHGDHLKTLEEQLCKANVLDKIDELAIAARAAMTAVAAPWYDVA